MDQSKKRKRNVNFTPEETEKFVSLLEAHKNIIENKKSDTKTWKKKEQAWKTIEIEFNCSGNGVFRDAKHLKLKYEALKRDIRRKSNIIYMECYKTGGDINEASLLTPVEQKVKEMILSVDTDENIYDSDQLETTVQPVNVEGLMTDTDDYSNHSIFELPEKPSKTKCLEQAIDSSTSKQVDENNLEHSTLCKPREKGPFDKLAEKKFEIVELQKKIIEEELEEKMLKKQMMKDEMQRKDELHQLEKEQMLLKIEILKTELEKKKS